jgi:hypothetical protein
VIGASSQVRLLIRSVRATFVALASNEISPSQAPDQDKCSVTRESFPFRQTGHGVTVIGGMNFLVVAPEPQEADE